MTNNAPDYKDNLVFPPKEPTYVWVISKCINQEFDRYAVDSVWDSEEKAIEYLADKHRLDYDIEMLAMNDYWRNS